MVIFDQCFRLKSNLEFEIGFLIPGSELRRASGEIGFSNVCCRRDRPCVPVGCVWNSADRFRKAVCELTAMAFYWPDSR
jgi:hypothetical protein